MPSSSAICDGDGLEPSRRQAPRDSMILSAQLTIQGDRTPRMVRVRNLANRGMMIDDCSLVVGADVSAALRGIGPVSGSVAWVKAGRAGIEFDIDIDHMLARAAIAGKDSDKIKLNDKLAREEHSPPAKFTGRPRVRF